MTPESSKHPAINSLNDRRPLLPNFLIVGAARCGTTSIYEWLRQHPDVFLPAKKEPAYFVHDFGMSSWDQYVALFASARGKAAVGEASVQYFDAPESPTWIQRTLGQPKIIIVLRNPVDRAMSLHALNVMDGTDWVPTLRRAVALESSRMNDARFRAKRKPAIFRHYLYARSGFYPEHVRRYFDVFRKESVRTYLFEDLVRDTVSVYANICTFLAVSAAHRPLFIPQNSSRVPKYVRLQYLAHKLSSLLEHSRAPFKNVMIRGIRELTARNARAGTKPSIDLEFRHQLLAMYKPSIEELGDLIGRDLSAWMK